MKRISKIVLTATVLVQLATFGARSAVYQLDNGAIGNLVNASDGTEPLDNWFGNEFTVVPNANFITGIDFATFTVAAGANAQIALYRVGNPAIGATRLYTQSFTPPTGNGTNVFLSHIDLTTPLALNVGDVFLVSVLIRNVIGLPPNDKYPFVIDTGTSSLGSFWDRSAPGTFNLDNLDAARLLTYALAPDGSGAAPFIPGPGHLILRADAVPEPATVILAGLGAAVLMIFRRRIK